MSKGRDTDGIGAETRGLKSAVPTRYLFYYTGLRFSSLSCSSDRCFVLSSISDSQFIGHQDSS